MIEDGKMRTQARGLGDLAQVRHSELAQRHALHRLSTQTQDAYSKGVLPSFNVSLHVTTTHQRAQQVTGGALRHFCYPTDFRRAESVIPAGQELENRQSTFH